MQVCVLFQSVYVGEQATTQWPSPLGGVRGGRSDQHRGQEDHRGSRIWCITGEWWGTGRWQNGRASTIVPTHSKKWSHWPFPRSFLWPHHESKIHLQIQSPNCPTVALSTYFTAGFLILSLWLILLNENGVLYCTVIPSRGNVMHSPLPWFVYCNFLQNVSSSFINPNLITWHAFSRTLHACTYALATHTHCPTPQVSSTKVCSCLLWNATVHKPPVNII